MRQARVLISILNWNKAAMTLVCLAALDQTEWGDVQADILVIDNGSGAEEYARLSGATLGPRTRILHLDKNLGFTGGHNVSLKKAVDEHYDFIWLLNNDALVVPSTMLKLVEALTADPRCGAVSPVVYAEEGVEHGNAWGVIHDWGNRDNMWITNEADSRRLHETQPDDICLAGTAVMFRVQAIGEVGVLDDRLFAYFDDNDIGTRLAHGGWLSKVVFDAAVLHGARTNAEQPLYYFYLMFRNEMLFWHTHTPPAYRRLLLLKLVDGGMFNVNRLRAKGMHRQADMALLGMSDFLHKKFGAPDLNRRATLPVRLLCRLRRAAHARHFPKSGDAGAVPG